MLADTLETHGMVKVTSGEILQLWHLKRVDFTVSPRQPQVGCHYSQRSEQEIAIEMLESAHIVQVTSHRVLCRHYSRCSGHEVSGAMHEMIRLDLVAIYLVLDLLSRPQPDLDASPS